MEGRPGISILVVASDTIFAQFPTNLVNPRATFFLIVLLGEKTFMQKR
jgi:hypothetical protein